MPKFLITSLFFLIIFSKGEAQTIDQISFNNETIESAILKLELKTQKKAYFDSEWLKGIYAPNKSYQEKTLTYILDDLLSDNNINYLVYNNQIILSKNNYIYSVLPDNFYPKRNKSSDSITSNISVAEINPVFYKNFENINSDDEIEEKISFIGKQKEVNAIKTYTISGKITDRKTGFPLSYLNIKTLKNDISTITNENGEYSLKLPIGENTVLVSSIGYLPQKRKIIVYSNGSLNFSLTESISQLDEVIISSKNREVIRTAITGVTTIDAKEIKNIPMVLGERDVLKVAVIMPGVKTAGEGSAGFNVRGGKTDQNLILLDGGLIYNPFHFFGFFSAVNPYTISKVDIYKGSIPSEFGGRLSSVFDIQTKDGDKNKFSGEAGIGPVTSNVMVNIPIVENKSSLIVGGRATYSDWILKSLDDEDLKDSQASFFDGLIKYNHILNENNNIEATAYYSKDKFNLTSDSLYSYSNRLASIKWNHTFSDKHRSTFLLTNTKYNFDIDYENNDEPRENFDFGFEINETLAKLKFNYALNKKHHLTYGVSSKLYNTKPGFFNPTDSNTLLERKVIDEEKALESGIFIADEFKFNDKLLINVGARLSNFINLGSGTELVYNKNLPKSNESVIDTLQYGNNEVIENFYGIEPRVSLRYFLTEDFSIKASYDRNKQYIHLLSTNTTQSPTDTWKISDTNIEPQTADQYSIGLYNNLKIKGEIFEATLEGYYKNLDNMLDYKVGAELILNQNLETEVIQGKGKAYGIEFLLKKPNGRLNGWIGYTYSRTFLKLDGEFDEEIVNGGDYFPANFDKPHDFSLVLNYKLTKRYSFSANFIYQTGRPITYPVGNYDYNNASYVLYSDRNEFRIPDYYRLDLGVNIEGNHKIKKLAHSFWNISIYNVLGRNNPYSVYFVTDNGEVKAYKTSIFSIPVPTVTYNFKF
jgi:hypothetical protein